MRVTWVCLEWPQLEGHAGGVGRYAFRLAERMRELVDLSVVTFEGALPIQGVDLVTIPRPGSRVGRYYGSAWAARHIVRQSSPAIVHSQGDDFLLAHEAPMVRSFHGTAWREAMSSHGLRRANHILLAGTEYISMARADLRLGVAPESARAYRCETIFPPYLPSSASRRTRSPHETPRVVFIGGFEGRKRGYLVEAAVSPLRAEAEVELVVVGPRDDAPRWAPWVDHRAGQSDDEVAELLSTAWVVAIPSSYEGFGIPSLEALDHGVRVVGSGNPGLDFIRSQGASEIPIEAVGDEGFARALRRAILAGPILDNHEQIAATDLVTKMVELGSPVRLVSLYQGVLDRSR